MEYNAATTVTLIKRCSNGDPLAWAEFTRRFSPLIKFSIKKALSKYAAYPHYASEDAKDIEQTIMASLWGKNRLNEIKNRESISYWLAITARNATINYLKSRQKEILISDKSFFEKLPSKKMEKENAGGGKIKEIYKTLSTKEKLIFKLYFKKDLGLKDISKIMHIPLGTVSSLVTRMRKKFKK